MGEPTLLDKIKSRLLNHPVVVGLALFVVGLTVVETATGNLTSIYDRFFVKESVVPVVRTKYYTVRGDGLSLLLSGDLTTRLAEEIGGKPMVMTNEVYDVLAELHNRSADLRGAGAEFIGLADPAPLVDTALLPETWGIIQASRDEVDKIPSFPKDLSESWHMRLAMSPYVEDAESEVLQSLREGWVSAEHTTFERYLTWGEIADLIKRRSPASYKLFEFVFRNGSPDDFFLATWHPEGCGPDPFLVLESPKLALRILVVENVSASPITIKHFNGRTLMAEHGPTPFEELILEKEYRRDLQNLVLKQDERLIIPVAVYFTWEDPEGYDTDIDEYLDLDLSQLEPLLKAQPEIVVTYDRSDEQATVANVPGESVLSDIEYFRAPREKRPDLYYVAQTVDELFANNRRETARHLEAGSIFISHGFGVGSCPFLYDSLGNCLGTVLTGRDTYEKRGFFRNRLPHASAEYTIRELEHEVSYIKWVRLACISPEGEQFHFYPVNHSLGMDNADYVILRKGDSITIEFDVDLEFVRGMKSELHTFGYYVPLLGTR